MGILCFIDADIGSLKYLRTLFDKFLDNMLVKFEQNHMVQNTQKFFGKKWLTIFEKVEQLFDAKVLVQRLSSFIVSKIIVVRHV